MSPFILHPEIEADSIFLRDLPLSQLRLQNQTAVTWLILIPRRAAMQEMHHLTHEDRGQLMNEICLASHALEHIFRPDKINVGALGNIVPQLHVHVIGRRRQDPAWPQPVWGRLERSSYPADKLDEMQKRLADAALWD